MITITAAFPLVRPYAPAQLRVNNASTYTYKCAGLCSENSQLIHNNLHFTLDLCTFFASAALAAVSKIAGTPSRVFAEHSMYACAPILVAISEAEARETGFMFLLARFFIVVASLRRSHLLPTSIKGVPGQKCLISGSHFSTTFSKLSGLSMEKQMRTTSVSG